MTLSPFRLTPTSPAFRPGVFEASKLGLQACAMAAVDFCPPKVLQAIDRVRSTQNLKGVASVFCATGNLDPQVSHRGIAQKFKRGTPPPFGFHANLQAMRRCRMSATLPHRS